MRELWETWQRARQTALRFWTRLSWGASPAYLWSLSHPGTSEGSLKRCAKRRGPPFLKVGVTLIPHSCDDHPENSFYFLRCVTLWKNAFFFHLCLYHTHKWCMRHRCFDILYFSQMLGRKKNNETLGAWGWEEEYEGVKCLSVIITKMAKVDRHASHSWPSSEPDNAF